MTFTPVQWFLVCLVNTFSTTLKSHHTCNVPPLDQCTLDWQRTCDAPARAEGLGGTARRDLATRWSGTASPDVHRQDTDNRTKKELVSTVSLQSHHPLIGELVQWWKSVFLSKFSSNYEANRFTLKGSWETRKRHTPLLVHTALLRINTRRTLREKALCQQSRGWEQWRLWIIVKTR